MVRNQFRGYLFSKKYFTLNKRTFSPFLNCLKAYVKITDTVSSVTYLVSQFPDQEMNGSF